jgi:hypothetical protein
MNQEVERIGRIPPELLVLLLKALGKRLPAENYSETPVTPR